VGQETDPKDLATSEKCQSVTRRDRIRRETDKKKNTVTLQVWNGKHTVMYLSMARETTVYTLPKYLQYQWWSSGKYNRPLTRTYRGE
jgi:hypothetical protein